MRVERAKCQGHAMCVEHAPDLVELDELGFNTLDGEIDVPEDQRNAAIQAARSCPERAITIIEATPAREGE
jgi:ferredoxin